MHIGYDQPVPHYSHITTTTQNTNCIVYGTSKPLYSYFIFRFHLRCKLNTRMEEIASATLHTKNYCVGIFRALELRYGAVVSCNLNLEIIVT